MPQIAQIAILRTDPSVPAPAGNRSRRTTWAGAYTDYDFNDINQLRSQTSYFANNRTARYDYGYDVTNRMKYEQRNSGLADGFNYDVRSELSGFHNNGTLNGDGNVSASYNCSFTYDNNGNRINANDGSDAPYTSADNNQYKTDWTGSIHYDDNANLTSRAGWTYTYDAQNRLTSIDSGSIHIHQHYDALNRIVARDYNGDITTNVWDNWDLIEEHYSNDAIRRCYLHGAAVNEIVASFDGPTYGDAFYFEDGRGNVTHLADDWSNLIEHYSYFVSGQPTIDDGYGNGRTNSIVDNRFLFKGALYVDSHLRNVPQADMYDMRNRFYHPNLGRFMQSDPTGFDAGDMNLFRYCGDDPVDRSDPMGLQDTSAAIWQRLAVFDTSSSSHSSLEQLEKQRQEQVAQDMASHAEENIGSTKYHNTRNWHGSAVYHCNEFPADMAEVSGRVRPQVWQDGFPEGYWRTPVSHEYADPNVKMPHWSAPRPVSEARRTDIIAQQHGKGGHSGVVIAPGRTITVDTRHGGIVAPGQWGFLPRPLNGEKPGDPAPVVRHYEPGAGSGW